MNKIRFLPAILSALLLLLGVAACGYRAPLTAELYNPGVYADHKIDLASVDSVTELYQIMKDTHEIFRQCQLSYWAEGGTMLGAVRNGGVIPWDDDNDISVSSKDVNQLLVLRPVFAELGYFIEKVFFGYRVVKDRTAAAVDIFLMNEVNGKFYYDRGDWGTRPTSGQGLKLGEPKMDGIYLTREEIYPLREVSFGPIKVMIPNDPKPYLDSMFRGWNDVAFTYGHAGQRKFKIDLMEHPEFRRAAPLDPYTLQTIHVAEKVKDRVSSTLTCPVPVIRNAMPFPAFFDGV